MKEPQRQEARRLRADKGWSIKRIAREVHAAQSTVSLWVRDIELTPEQRHALRDWADQARRDGNARTTERARGLRRDAQEEGRRRAREGDPVHLTGCMLYWAEGSKAKNHVEFVNSDGGMVALFVRFLRECYDVPNDRILLTCNCFTNNGLTLEGIEDWWLEAARARSSGAASFDRQHAVASQSWEAPCGDRAAGMARRALASTRGR